MFNSGCDYSRMPKPLKTVTRSRYVTSTVSGERVRAFVPAPLPPDAQTLDLASLQTILAEANQAVGRLDGMTSAFPDLNLFLYSYVRKEAVLSSQIEGTQSSLADLLLYENAETPGVPLDDVREVSNYVAALNHGLKRLRGGFPLSLRLIREIHEVLLAKGGEVMPTPVSFARAKIGLAGRGLETLPLSFHLRRSTSWTALENWKFFSIRNMTHFRF